MSKILNLLASDVLFQAPNAPEPVFGRGSARTPLGELMSLSLRPLVDSRERHPLHIPSPLDAFGMSSRYS